MAGSGSLVNPLIGTLFTVPAAEGYGGIAAAYGSIGVACGA